MQECNNCGKELRARAKAIAITGGTMDYKNCEGFRPNDDAYIEILCPKCQDKRRHIRLAYAELWAAVENGQIDKRFFSLRAKFRRLTQ